METQLRLHYEFHRRQMIQVMGVYSSMRREKIKSGAFLCEMNVKNQFYASSYIFKIGKLMYKNRSSTFILAQVPRYSSVIFSSFSPRSSDTTWPPVITARSWSIAFLLSPNPEINSEWARGCENEWEQRRKVKKYVGAGENKEYEKNQKYLRHPSIITSHFPSYIT